MKGKEIIFALSILALPAPTLAGTPKMMVEAQTSTTIRQQMDWLHRIRKINFVYDSSLDGDLNIKYHGPDIQHLPVKKALKALFEQTHILYNINANYVILKRKPVQQISTSYTNINHKVQQVQRRHTLSGYVRDESGESLINATIYDLTDGIGTTTNEYGFFSLTLPEGEHQLRFSYVGYADKVEKLNLSKDMHHNMALRVDGKLPEVVVDGDLNSPLLTTQTGKRSFSNKDIKTEFALMSSPDVVKTLQRVSGVAEGQELASGLYVHGASASEITSGALQDFDRAVVLGTRTYGKGLVQVPNVPLPYNGKLKLTTAKYYIPSGRCIQAINNKHSKGGYTEHVPDSLTRIFHTAAGREVRDGGGIKPDVVVEADSLPNIALYLERVDTTSVLLNYEVEYLKNHPTVAKPSEFEFTDADYALLKKHIIESGFTYDRVSDKYLKDLERMARFEGYYDDAKAEFEALEKKLNHNLDKELDWPYNKEHIKQMVALDLMAVYYYQKGAIEHSLRYDPQYKEAVRLLNAQDEYEAILKGTKLAEKDNNKKEKK